MADYNLGIARGIIEIGFRDKGVDKAVAALETVAETANIVSTTVKNTGKAAIGTGATIAAGLGFAVKSAASFEAGMSAVAAVSGATTGEMEKLREKALQLGQDTAFGATESASAMEELVKAGLSVADVLNGAADATVNLAAAGQISLPEAATIASNAMNQFGLAAEDLPKVADAIAGAANASAISVGEFGFSLSQVGAVANLAGQNFEDTATAIALLGNAGIKGSDAGTSLKTMFASLNPVTEKQIALFDELGITVDGTNSKLLDAKGNFKGLAEISEVLNQAFGFTTISTEEFNQAVKQGADPLQLLKASANDAGKAQQLLRLETAFGSDAIRAAAILAKNGAAGFNEMAAAMGEVTAADVAAKRLDNLNGAIEQLKGSFEVAAITVGTVFLPVVKAVAEAVTAAVDVFNSLPGPVKTAVAIFAGLVAALFLVTGAMLALGPILIAFILNLLLMKYLGTIIKLFKIYRAAVIGATTATAAHVAAQKALQAAWLRTTFLGKALIFTLKALRKAWILVSGPIGIAIAAVAALGAAIFLMGRKSKPEVEDLTEAFKAEADGMVGAAREAERLRLEKDGLLDTADKLKISLDDVIDSSLGNADAQKRLTDAIAAAKKPMQEYIAQQQAITVDSKASAREQAKARYNITRASLDGLLALEALTGGVRRETEAVGVATTKHDQFKRSQDNVAAAAKKAEDAIKGFSSALDVLFRDTFDVPRALDAVRSGMNNLVKAAKENGTVTRGNTDLAISNRNALRDQVNAISDVLKKMGETGSSSAQVEAQAKRLTTEFTRQAKEAGFNSDQLEIYTQFLKNIPGTVPTELTVEAVKARAEAGSLQAAINKLRDRQLKMELKGTDAALVEAAALKTQIDALRDRQVRLGLIGVDGAISEINNLQARINGMSGRSISIDVNTNSGTGVFKVPAAARGGIATRATLAVVGEGRSPEAIVPLPDLAQSFLRIFEAGRVSPQQALASAGAGGRAPAARDSSSSRIVSGTLGIDRSGRAWIKGVAQDVYDGEDDFAGTYGRMG